MVDEYYLLSTLAGGSIPVIVDLCYLVSILACGSIPIIVDLLYPIPDKFVGCLLPRKCPLDGMLCCTCFCLQSLCTIKLVMQRVASGCVGCSLRMYVCESSDD